MELTCYNLLPKSSWICNEMLSGPGFQGLSKNPLVEDPSPDIRVPFVTGYAEIFFKFLSPAKASL